ncbi:adenine nucleotide alpha hydrolase family protein [Histidinibacterium aquaticum]|uniref:Universal stress protein n=1 Tax=Histidinibacterium aquaticum TaxID=2613962 RepID=A0A5J5GGP5_9RHOB|nr:universal stress protein [Histidinibacterium aquaticum]KAA9006694.1 hypothetical protein F3S47_12985 [Histidinibacterium aquaticum]
MRVETILTCFDGSSAGEEQLRSAIHAAHWFDAELSVASVAYLPDTGPEAARVSDPETSRRVAVREAMDRARMVFGRLEAERVRGTAFPFVTTRKAMTGQFDCLSHFADVTVRPGSFGPSEDGSPRFGDACFIDPAVLQGRRRGPDAGSRRH